MLVNVILHDTDTLNLMFQIAMKEASISPEGKKEATSLVVSSMKSGGWSKNHL